MPFLFQDDFHCTTTTIRGVRYVTFSHYSGDKDIFQKMEDLISHSYQSSDFNDFPTETLVDDDIAFKQAV